MRLIDADALRLRFVPKQAYLTDHILEKIDTAPTVCGWISVNDRSPEEDGLYTVYCKDGSMAHAWFEDKWFIDHCECGDGYVTHWMPLPEPPKEEPDANSV